MGREPPLKQVKHRSCAERVSDRCHRPIQESAPLAESVQFTLDMLPLDIAAPLVAGRVRGTLYPHLVIFFCRASTPTHLERKGSVFRHFT